MCFERGAVTSCLVATPEFRIIRERTRYRRDLTGERTREKNRAEKLLESAAIKLSSVVTDLHGVTGRDIMDRLPGEGGGERGILVGRAARAVPGTLRALAGEFTVLALAVAAYTLLPQEGALVTLGLLAVGMAIQFSATKNPRKILALVTLLAGAAVGGLVSAGSIPGALIIGVVLVPRQR